MLDQNEFHLPIEFLDKINVIEQHTINDLELNETINNKSLYVNLIKPETIFAKKTLPLWSKYYTSDISFLKDSQTLLKNKTKTNSHEIKNEMQENIEAIWQEIKNETGFEDKYSYIEWKHLSLLNKNAKFLQCLSIYNMASPIFSLMLPILLLLIPLIIIKVQGLPITIEKYIELLKFVFKKHQIGQIFDISNASFEKIVYICATSVFYVIQVYQNIMSCLRFYKNINKIHYQLFMMRDYLDITVKNMDSLIIQCNELKTYASFNESIKHHRAICYDMLKKYKPIIINKISLKKIGQIGYVMECFYQLYKDENFHKTIEYSFGINGYIDNLEGIRKSIKMKHVGACKFKTNVKNDTKFVDAYFPTLVYNNPVKNTYKLDKHLLITGPNAAGKTTLLKTTIFNIIISQQIGFGFYKRATLVPYDMIHCYINIPDTSSRDSLFQAEAKRCKDILTKINDNNDKFRHFCVFDELYSGTNPYEAISSAYAFLNYLNKYDNVNFVLTTHFLELCRRLEKEKYMNNYHMMIETINEDFKYTYKMKKGISDIKGGIKILKDLEYPLEILNNTSSLLKELVV